MNLIRTIRRTFRPAGKTLQAIARWKRFSFNDAPPIFGNSKPKSGSHLLLQILNGFTQIMPYRYVDADPIRTIKKDGGRRMADSVLSDLKSTSARRHRLGLCGSHAGECRVSVPAGPGQLLYLPRPARRAGVTGLLCHGHAGRTWHA